MSGYFLNLSGFLDSQPSTNRLGLQLHPFLHPTFESNNAPVQLHLPWLPSQQQQQKPAPPPRPEAQTWHGRELARRAVDEAVMYQQLCEELFPDLYPSRGEVTIVLR